MPGGARPPAHQDPEGLCTTSRSAGRASPRLPSVQERAKPAERLRPLRLDAMPGRLRVRDEAFANAGSLICVFRERRLADLGGGLCGMADLRCHRRDPADLNLRLRRLHGLRHARRANAKAPSTAATAAMVAGFRAEMLAPRTSAAASSRRRQAPMIARNGFIAASGKPPTDQPPPSSIPLAS